MTAKKIYILDTNVLLHDPRSLFSFAGAHVGIPAIVLEELDHFKSDANDRGRNSREVARQLDALRQQGSLRDGVEMPNGSTIQVLFLEQPIEERPTLLRKPKADHDILATALFMKQQGHDVVLVTKDINARVKADVLGIVAEDYLVGRVSEYELFKGWQTVIVPAIQLTKSVPPELVARADNGEFEINEYALVQSQGNQYNFKVFRYLGNKQFRLVEHPQMGWPIQARNAQQLMTLDLLFDREIQLICLVGPAGTGKTFLALLAGLHQVLIESLYEKILISRPVIPLGPDIGYLPGDIQEKLHSWMQPMYDNMGIIVHSAAMHQHGDIIRDEASGMVFHKKNRRKERFSPLRSLDDMVASGKISLEAITYMRGRSIPYQYILIDEVQNLTPHEVKTLITRVGEGSKIILCGDPYQIDSPYLDFSSNGLVIASNAFKGNKIFGTVFLETTERSELSKLASELL